MSKKEEGVRIKPPFGLRNTRIVITPDGKCIYYWQMRWWYAVYHACKMAIGMCFCGEMYSEHCSEELEQFQEKGDEK